jgi:hypothetical protein
MNNFEVKNLKFKVDQLTKVLENILDLHSGWICDCYACTLARRALDGKNVVDSKMKGIKK